ncbi:MAG: PepSY-associated TM helix domain-containing protein, partial [Pseudorhodoplanes sp.]
MLSTFRQSMTWLHTWCGLVVGWVLFAIFFSGTLAVFRHEIDYWMAPELHVAMDTDRAVKVSQQVLQQVAPTATRWVIDLPTNRTPVLRVRWQADPKQRFQSRSIDSAGHDLAPR